ncbi:hypothetical protein ElyMa_003868600 [Elysia marginata]|uniref:Uncharacterized protein n=1 Tax=Elysia marginata TaxID=1093978 RepID=A0AAV4FKL2_9GAST|nr:hypothetical protein ElyMa_003868600 [Elysia marginata]
MVENVIRPRPPKYTQARNTIQAPAAARAIFSPPVRPGAPLAAEALTKHCHDAVGPKQPRLTSPYSSAGH